MSEYTFEHEGPVYELPGEKYDSVYYSLKGAKYRRVRRVGAKEWESPDPTQVSDDEFWMIVACIERRPRHATH